MIYGGRYDNRGRLRSNRIFDYYHIQDWVRKWGTDDHLAALRTYFEFAGEDVGRSDGWVDWIDYEEMIRNDLYAINGLCIEIFDRLFSECNIKEGAIAVWLWW